jgi:hypothetical protein
MLFIGLKLEILQNRVKVKIGSGTFLFSKVIIFLKAQRIK